MTHTEDDIVAIAKGLTKAQRDAVLYREYYGATFGTIYANAPTMNVLDRLGLLRERDGGLAFLNETGLAVRAYLLEQKP